MPHSAESRLNPPKEPVMTPKKILLMAHDVTLAHLGRPLRLAEGLIADGHAVTLAASAESARFL